jgi:hypothetical protein
MAIAENNLGGYAIALAIFPGTGKKFSDRGKALIFPGTGKFTAFFYR